MSPGAPGLKETRTPISATNHHPRRVDYEYERAGTASPGAPGFCQPLSGWRQVTVRQRRTKIDWANEVEELLRTRYASAEKVILVCDNLNPHTKGAFYEAFDPEKARDIVRRLEFRHTPKHGSWLNMAENELSSMTRQCVKDRRFATIRSRRAGNQKPPPGINGVTPGNAASTGNSKSATREVD